MKKADQQYEIYEKAPSVLTGEFTRPNRSSGLELTPQPLLQWRYGLLSQEIQNVPAH